MSDKKLVSIALISALMFLVALTTAKPHHAASSEHRSTLLSRKWHQHEFKGVGHLVDLQSLPNGTTFATFYESGVFRTTDGGITWQNVTNGLKPSRLCIGFGRNNTVFVGGGRGVYRSDDNGDHWQPLNKGLENAGIEKIAQDMDGNMVVSWRRTDEKHHVSCLDRDGQRWRQIHTPPWALGDVLNVFPQVGGRQYVVTWGGVYIATGDWSKWRKLSLSTEDDYLKSGAIYKDGRVALIAGVSRGQSERDMYSVYILSADGTKWSRKLFYVRPRLFMSSNVSPNRIAWTSEGHLLVGTDDGVYESDDEGSSWNSTNARTREFLSFFPPYISEISVDRAGRIYLGAMKDILASEPEPRPGRR